MALNKFEKIIADQQLELKKIDLSKLCHRKEEELFELESPLAQIVIGVRRCGKSTLCHKVLLQQNEKYAYINFDDERLLGFDASQFDEIFEGLLMVYGEFKYLFLDEIQNVKGWDLFVNRLLRQKQQLVITGSNAKLLSSELSTYLTGRYNQIELFPFSFAEFLQFKHLRVDAINTYDIAFRKSAFNEYMQHGGFPELFNLRDKKGYIQRLVNNIVMNDICKRYNIRFIDTLVKLTNYLISNFAQELNYDKTANIFGIKSTHTAKNYINYLRQSFLIVTLNKFSYKAKERIRNEKAYLIDPALFSTKENNLTSESIGWNVENIVYLELLRRKKYQQFDIYYFREAFEIDFVLCNTNKVLELIQVTTDIESPKTLKREMNGLLKGAEKTNCLKLTLLSFRETQQHVFEDKTINEISVIDWLCEVYK